MRKSLPAVTLVLAAVAGAALLPAPASAMCSLIIDQQDRQVYQSGLTPIDLSHPISVEMARKYPGQHLTIVDTACGARADRDVVAGDAIYAGPPNASSALGRAAAVRDYYRGDERVPMNFGAR